MSVGYDISYGREPLKTKIWGIAFWICLGANLTAMQFLLAFVMVAPFVLVATGLAGLVAWLPLLAFQGLYVGGIWFASVIRRHRPFIAVCTLIATPIAIYGTAYLLLKADLLNPTLMHIFS